MTTTDTPAFICIICARVVREAHVPPIAPKCPSCGANTRPNVVMKAKAGDVKCMHCGYIEPAYAHDRCPKCDTVYVTFATRLNKA